MKLSVSIIGLLLILLNINYSFAQVNERIIKTDSSVITITWNQYLLVTEEKFNNRASVYFTTRLKEDSTILSKGWTRNNYKIGKWDEYSENGTWLKSLDYDKQTWKCNTKKHPYKKLVDSLKKCADNILISEFGQDFFNKHVRFRFEGGLSKEKSIIQIIALAVAQS